MLVIKRDGRIEEFNEEKIKSAIIKAAKSVNLPAPIHLAGKVTRYCNNKKNVTVEMIQDKLEYYLMFFGYHEIAKSYIIYRNNHSYAREIKDRINYMENYSKSKKNPAQLSETDANANVSMKNVVTLESEVPKKQNRIIQRQRMKDKLNELFPEVAEDYERDLNNHIIYTHDEASSAVPKNYCEAVTLYPLLINKGVGNLDGVTPTPANWLDSFCGQFNNLVFLLSAQCKGAVAFGEFFNFFDYFCVKEFGEDYHLYDSTPYTSPLINHQMTISDKIESSFQNIVYYINQPAQNRGWQSPFTNFSYYDKYYWEALFSDFYFPDGTKPKWERVSYLQKKFIKWFNKERTKALLTYPVETMALLTDSKGNYLDKEYKEFTAEMHSEGHSFFIYVSDNPNSLSSCCRLKSTITSNEFSFTSGLTGVKTGSCNVITLNLNRIIQDWVKEEKLYVDFDLEKHKISLQSYLINILSRVYKYHIAYKNILYDWEERGMFTASNNGYITMKDLFSTIGINGLNEAATFLGYTISYNKRYKEFCRFITSIISDNNRFHSTDKIKFNLEFVPKRGGHVKPLLIDLKLLTGQQGASKDYSCAA
jgi:ribonucleoside-triphosphate reductase